MDDTKKPLNFDPVFEERRSNRFQRRRRRRRHQQLPIYDIFDLHSYFPITNFKLSKIKIKNFKSIQNSEFDISQTVFLSGLNSSGKSTYTQAVLLILQWLSGASSGRKGHLPLNGELISLGMVKDIYNRESLNETSKFFLQPISIELQFSEQDSDNVGFNSVYSINFELTPKFIKRKKSLPDIFDVENDTDIEITKVSSKIFIDKNDAANKEAVLTNKIFQPHEDEWMDEDITIESIYKKTYSNYTRRELAKKHFLGTFIAGPFSLEHFYLYDLENSSVPEFTQSVKFGKKIKIKDSRLFPEDVFIGADMLPNGLKSKANDLLQVKTQSLRSSNNPNDQEKINKYINEELGDVQFREIANVNSFPVKGKDLAKIRLFVQFVVAIINDFFTDSEIESYINGKTPSDGKGFKNYSKIIKSINDKKNLKNNAMFESDSPFLDELIGIYSNIKEIKISSKDQNELSSRFFGQLDDEMSEILDPSTGFNIDYPDLLKKKTKYIKNKKNGINEMHKVIEFDSETNEYGRGFFRRNQFSDIMLMINKYLFSTLLKDEETSKSSKSVRPPRFGDKSFWESPAGKLFDDTEKKIFIEENKNLHIKFLDLLNELVIQCDKVGLDYWKDLAKTKTFISGGIEDLDDEFVNNWKIREYISHIFYNMFPSLSDEVFPGSSETEQPKDINDIRNYAILKLYLKGIKAMDMYGMIMDLKEDISFSELLEKENKKVFTNKELALKRVENQVTNDIVNYFDDDALDSQGGANVFDIDGRSLVEFDKSKINDYVFVNFDAPVGRDNELKTNWFPYLAGNFSFLSGSVNRNSNQIGSSSRLTPLGFHGERLGTAFNLESEKTISAPTPDSLKILDNKKYQKKFFNERNEIDYESLFIRPKTSEQFVTSKTLSSHLSDWIQYIGFGERVTTETTEWGVTSLNIQSSSGVDKINNVGSGVSQALPVILQILLSEDKVLFLEEIEQNLHASAQARLADMILLFSLDPNRNFIIETHSEHLINRLRLWKMQLGKLIDPNINSPYDVYFATRDTKKGTILKRMHTDEDGYFTDDNFPDGFFDQAQKDIREIMQKRLEDI